MMDDKEMKLCEEIKEEKNIHTMFRGVHTNDIYEDTNEKDLVRYLPSVPWECSKQLDCGRNPSSF